MSKKTGYTADTKKHLHLGAGVFYKNFEVGTDTYDTASAKIIGATQGGGEFKAIPTIHQVAIDGIAGKAAEMAVLDEWEVSLTANFIETSEEVIKVALGAASIDTTTDTNYDIITGKTEIESTDYLDNVTYLGTISGSDKPVIIQVYNALCSTGLDIKTEDKGEGVIAATFDGYYEAGSEDSAPFKIYYPKIS